MQLSIAAPSVRSLLEPAQAGVTVTGDVGEPREPARLRKQGLRPALAPTASEGAAKDRGRNQRRLGVPDSATYWHAILLKTEENS
jgi:hypothetical protein